MQLLHAHWHFPSKPTDEEGMLFWAEDSEAAPPKAGRGRKSKATKDHPFCADFEAIKKMLRTFDPKVDTGRFNLVKLLLPSGGAGPRPSPQLAHDWDIEEDSPPVLAPWMVSGVWLRPVETFYLLNNLPDPERLPAHLALGPDVHYWRFVTGFILEILAQQKLLPTLAEVNLSGTAFHARWMPVLDGPQDAPRLAHLLEAMPPLCRAEAETPDKAPFPRIVLETFLNSMTDALARQWGQPQGKPFAPAGHGEPAHEWLNSLFVSNPQVAGSAAQLKHLGQSHKAWLRNLNIAGDRTFRVAFRLEAPAQQAEEENPKEAKKAWRLHYLLQARDDPSLLIPAQQVWQTKGNVLKALNRRFEQPQEKLLTGLGHAARFFPPLRDGLKTARPVALTLSNQDAFDFMRGAAPLLEASGFGVLVPPWWNKPGTRLGIRLKLASNRKGPGSDIISNGALGFENLVRYTWELAVGDTTLTREEFDALVALKSPLVQIRGQWVQLDPSQIEAAIQFWEKQNLEAEIGLQEALQLGLGAADMVEGLPVTGVEFEGWLADWIERLTGGEKLRQLPQPEGLQAQLRPYQQYGYSWLDFLRRWGMGACLADDMGLGKCISADSLVAIDGRLETAETIWASYAAEAQFDGEGFWALPTKSLLVNAINENTGQIVATSVQRLYRQRVQEKLRRVRLEDGSCISITYRHRLLTNKGWTNQLQVGDYVCVPAKAVWAGQPEDPDLIKFLAWQIAEGYELPDRATVLVSQKDTQQLELLVQTLQNVGQRYNLKINQPVIRTHPGKTPALIVNSRAYQQFLEAKGYIWGKKSAHKSIPSFIMQADLDTLRLFLQNYFEAEASAIFSMRSIEISTASAFLMQQLSLLLRRFGIWLRISARQKRATNGTGIFRTYYVGIIGGNGARKFFNEIGFVSPEKQQKLENICRSVNNTNVEGIPASDIVAEMVRGTGLPIRHFGMHNTVYLDGSQQFSETSLERVIDQVDHILSGQTQQQYQQQKRSKWTAQTLEAYTRLDLQQLSAARNQLQHLLDQEVFYCRIKAIEEVDYDGWVYDFEIADHHNFMANNIICHNTIQTIAMLLHEKEEKGSLPGPVLLICPTSVVANWAREVERFAPKLTFMTHQGISRQRDEALIKQVKESDMVLTSYAIARRDAPTLQQVDWFGVILDEAQNIKNPEAKQTRAIRQLPAQFRLALTGTPVENRLSELWSIMQFLNPGYLGSRQIFRQHFALPIERYGDEEMTQRLRKMVSPFILRRLKTDPKVIQDLPEKQEMKVYCNLSEEQATLYESVVQSSIQAVEQATGIERRGLVLAMLMKLKQICNHPAQFLHQIGEGIPFDVGKETGRSGKLARLAEMLEEAMSVGDRVLIFSQFAEMGHFLKRHLQERLGVATLFLHGGTPAEKRAGMVKRFQEDPSGPPIFVLSLKAGGTGLNLTRANHVFHFDRWWNPAVEDQATDRAFRIGQKQNVQVHKFVCVGTMEEMVDAMIESKKALAQSVVGAGENWLTEVSTAELRELVTLRREMIQ